MTLIEARALCTLLQGTVQRGVKVSVIARDYLRDRKEPVYEVEIIKPSKSAASGTPLVSGGRVIIQQASTYLG